jgi:iron uptake system component EfeO
MHRLSLRFVCAMVFAMTACSGSDSALTDAQYKEQITTGMQTSLLTDLDALVQASKDLQTAAPTGHGWDPTADGAAITSMKDAWIRARTAYEHVEGALAPIFPEVDVSIDERYDGFLETAPDAYLFDDQGVTGLHAVERIVYSDVTPSSVVDFEKALIGYEPAAFPASADEAADFKTKLVTKMIADAQALRDGWTPAKISLGDAFNGLIGLMNEQKEKVNNAGLHHEESRYSQRTMADLRDNLAGTKKIYEIFQPWLVTKTGTADGKQTDTAIDAGFANLATEYATVSGTAFPPAPATWDADNPTAADLDTDFGKLYTSVRAETDPQKKGSIVAEMITAGALMGLPPFTD